MKGRETYRKIITSKENTEKINKDNIKLMERFLKNLSTKRSPKTIDNYKSNLIIFFTWNLLENNNIYFIDLKKYMFMDFFDYCVTELKWSANRYSQMHSCLSSFSNWIENIYDDRYPNFRNLVKKIEKLPKENVRKKSVFKKEELDILMNWLGENGYEQEQCLLSLIMASGSRVSELVRFKTIMINENHTAFDGLFLETTEDIKVKGRGVNGKYIPRYIIKDMFIPYYNKWIDKRKFIMKENKKEHDFIFIKKDGTPAEIGTIRSWMNKWDTVLNSHWYPHAGRHFWCSYLMQIGLEKQLVQELQSWSTDSLVDIYNDNTAKDIKWKSLDKLRNALKENNSLNE